MYTLGTAAKACGKSKATISNALKSGKLSFVEKTKAGYKIDPAELHRVFPKPLEPSNMNNPEPSSNTSETVAMQALQREIELLKDMVEREKLNADEWRKQAQTLAITDQRQKRGLWSRLTKGAA